MKKLTLYLVAFFLIGCQADFRPLVTPLSGVEVARGKDFIVQKVVIDTVAAFMVFYNRNIETGLKDLNNTRLKIDGQQGSILYLPNFDNSMIPDLERIR
jgi:hypothetical protein